jgi:hypothetical protein
MDEASALLGLDLHLISMGKRAPSLSKIKSTSAPE